MLIVCKKCLCEIENHNGKQEKKQYVYSECYKEDVEELICEWCENEYLSEDLYVI